MPNFARSIALISILTVVAALVLCVSTAAWARESETKPLVLGVHPYLAPSELIERFTPLAEYLSRKTGREVRVSISRDYQEHITRFGEGEIDFAYMGPASYVSMVSTYGIQPLLAMHEVRGVSSFRGVIIKKAGSRISGLKDLKGKRFAFGDPNSTMSHLVPRFMLLEAGVDITALAGYEFLNSHDNVALGVLMGDFDAGAVKEEAFYKYRDRGLEAIEFSPNISEHLFIANSYLPDETVKVLRDSMLGLSKAQDAKEILESLKPGTTGLVSAGEKDYESLRRIMEGLKKEGITP